MFHIFLKVNFQNISESILMKKLISFKIKKKAKAKNPEKFQPPDWPTFVYGRGDHAACASTPCRRRALIGFRRWRDGWGLWLVVCGSDVTGKIAHGWFLRRQGRQRERRCDAVGSSTECPVFGFNERHAVSYKTHKNTVKPQIYG